MKSVILNISISIFLFTVLTFGRSFIGLYILSFRIGEGLVAFGFLTLLYFFIFKLKDKRNFELIKLIKLNLGLFLFFLLNLFIYRTNVLEPYTFKASSYIWVLGYFYIGFIYKESLSKINLIQIFKASLIYIYIISTIYYPKNLISLFISYSDKFQFPKATDTLLLFVLTIYFTNRFSVNKLNNLIWFMFLSSTFLPLFIYKSKGSFFAALVFILIELKNSFPVIKYNYKKMFLISIFSIAIFFGSTLNVQNEKYKLSETSEAVGNLFKEKDTVNSFASLYIYQGRIYSLDGNLNWRLQIWQDITENLLTSKKILIGYGYNEIIPAMDNPDRNGLDTDEGFNENVHNFLINVLARGGLFQLFIYLTLLFNIIFKHKKTIFSNDLLFYSLPLLLASCFDTSMESAHFPSLFYLFLGYLFNHYNKVELSK